MLIKSTSIMLAALGCVAGLGQAQDATDKPDFLGGDFSASVAITSDYTFRGISQSSGDWAVQGSVDWASDLFYTGVWGSTVDFNDDIVNPFTGEEVSDGTSTEIDFYAGVTPSLGPVSFDLGVVYYLYPNAPQGGDDVFVPTDVPVDPAITSLPPGALFFDSLDQNYVELAIGASYTAFDRLELGLKSAWSPDYYFEAGNSLHTNFTAALPLGELDVAGTELAFAISGNAAHLQFFEDDEAEDNSGFEDYWEFGVGMTVSVFGFDLDARYIDTSSLAGNGSTGVFTISRSF